jgi:aminomethyltransferase
LKWVCLYGNDINDTTSPLEAGLGWITKLQKEFTNSETEIRAGSQTDLTLKMQGCLVCLNMTSEES